MEGIRFGGAARLLGSAVCLLCSLLHAVSKEDTDVWLYKVTKGIHYQQGLSGDPTVLPENGYVFQANVFLTGPHTVIGASVRSQEGTERVLEFDDDDELEFRNRVNTKATLESRYPDGYFTFTINAIRDGLRVVRLSLFGNTYPNAPRIHNVGGLQALNANGYIIVNWDPLAGGTAEDFIQLRIEDSTGDLAFETRDLGQPGALDGTATFTLIEPGELKPNTRYTARVTFEKSCGRDTASYPGAVGWSTYHARTEFPMATSGAVAPDVQSYEVSKGREFVQTNSATPVPDTGDEFVFVAEAQGSAANRIASAILTPPGGRTITLEADSDREEFDFEDNAPDQSSLDARYPPGTYVFTFQTASQGNRSVGFDLNASTYPPAPRVHFDPSGEVRPEQESRIVWDSWPGGTGNDFIQLRIEDDDGENVFETPDFDDKDALDGRATSAAIPPGTFVPGEKYDARLTFRRYVRLDANTYPGALAIASYYARTKFEIEGAPPDVKSYEIAKGHAYFQSSSGAPTLTGFVFRVTLEAEAAQSVNSVAIVTQNGRTVPLIQQPDGETFRLVDVKPSQAALDADYPDGNYTLTVNAAHDGQQVVNVPLSGGLYPNAPRVSNYDEAGRINPSADFVLRWDNFAGGTVNDFINVEIEETDGDQLFDMPGYRKDNALDGLDTFVTIPTNTLRSGRAYLGELTFEKVLRSGDSTYPGVDERIGYFARTEFGLATIGLGNPPTLQSYQMLGDRRVQLDISTLDGGSYEIQGSSDMQTWTILGTISANDNRTTFLAAPPPVTTCYFYRAVLRR